MSSEASEVLNTLGEKFGLFVDWSQQNVQPYIEDLMQRVTQYKIVSNICGLVFMMLVVITSAIVIFRFLKMKSYGKITIDNEEQEITLVIISSVCLLIGLVTSILIIENILQCYYIPEIAFIEEINKLME